MEKWYVMLSDLCTIDSSISEYYYLYIFKMAGIETYQQSNKTVSQFFKIQNYIFIATTNRLFRLLIENTYLNHNFVKKWISKV